MNHPARLLLALRLALAVASAAALDRSEVRVDLLRDPATAPMRSSIRITAGPDGAQVLEVDATNLSPAEIVLRKAEVEFPWLATGGSPLLISSGGTVMGNWPESVVDPAQSPTPPVSGTYLLARRSGGCSLAGLVSWKTFWSKIRYESGRLVLTADGEGRRVRPGETVALEKLWLGENPNWQDLLFDYAAAIARELQIKLKPPRQWTGWSTWDYYGRTWTAAEVIANRNALLKLVPQSNLLQIDGGWWPNRGDYLDVRADLRPEGMKGLAGQIRAKGLTAGIHLDGTRAAAAAVIVRQHPEFFLKDQTGALIGDGQGNRYFDYSCPGARDYMRNALRRIRRDWGYDYLKIDFLSWGIDEYIRQRVMKNDPAREIVPYDRHFTSIERLRLALAAFRDGMGGDAYFLGCSAPFGPVFGFVDGLRTGPDISPNFDQVRRSCEATGSNFYLQGRVVYTDADYQVGRSGPDEDATRVKDPGKAGRLTLNEAAMWADYVALFGGTHLSSDDLLILRPEREALFQAVAAQASCSRFVPLDYWQHGRSKSDACDVFLGVAGSDIFLGLFNWSDAPRRYRLSGLSPAEVAALRRVHGDAAIDRGEREVRVSLPARHSAVFTLGAGSDFDRLRKAVIVE